MNNTKHYLRTIAAAAGTSVLVLLTLGAAIFPVPGAAAQSNVTVGDDFFAPRTIVVNIGDSVTWTNTGSMAHTVTADNGGFESGTIMPGQSFSHTFNTAGTFNFYCRFHGGPGGQGMSGTVIVQNNQTPNPNPTPSPTGCVVITHTLYFGSRDSFTGGDVTKLQQFLTAQGYYHGQVIGIFGPVTARAVQAYQTAHGISPVGIVGPVTRASIQQVSCGGNPPPTNVQIRSLTPTSGPVGTQVTITGFGFTSDNTIHFGNGVIMHVPISSQIAIACTNDPSCVGGIQQTLVFTVPDGLNPACYYSNPRCLIATQQTTPGNYAVSVENTNGTSNAQTFTVTGTQTANPSISSITPVSGPVGTTVTVNGSGFTNDNIIFFGNGAISQHAVSGNGTSLTFVVPSGIGPYCPPNAMCPMYFQQVTPGPYNVYVQNGNGSSNTTVFTVTGDSGTQGPSITGISGPNSLAVGAQGTWTINSLSGAGTVSTNVTWGDENNYYPYAMTSGAQYQSTNTFSHTYYYRGTYTIRFTVTDSQGRSAQASATVNVY